MNIQACTTCTDICCKRTTYKLTKQDVERLGSLLVGAVFKTQDGHLQLKQPCPFLIDNKCSIYNIRPVGCRLYPVVWNNGLTTDHNCPGHNEIINIERNSIALEVYFRQLYTVEE